MGDMLRIIEGQGTLQILLCFTIKFSSLCIVFEDCESEPTRNLDFEEHVVDQLSWDSDSGNTNRPAQDQV